MGQKEEIVFDVARTLRVNDTRPWWQICGVPELKTRLASMATDDLRLLTAEIDGVIANVEAQIQSGVRRDEPGWFPRIKAMRGYVTEKRHLVRAELVRRNQPRDPKRHEAKMSLRHQELLPVRDALAEDDVKKALTLLLDWLER